jgi:hypothetical protein
MGRLLFFLAEALSAAIQRRDPASTISIGDRRLLQDMPTFILVIAPWKGWDYDVSSEGLPLEGNEACAEVGRVSGR